MNNKEHPSQPKKFENGKLEALLEEDSCQTIKELKSEILNVDESIVSKRLKAMGMIQKLENWIPHELRERDIAVVIYERVMKICNVFLIGSGEQGLLPSFTSV